jgi:hypothetical protein
MAPETPAKGSGFGDPTACKKNEGTTVYAAMEDALNCFLSRGLEAEIQTLVSA